MIKPSSLHPTCRIPPNHERHLKLLEQRIDMSIQHADDVGQWPAVVDQIAGETFGDITLAEVVELYRAEGYTVIPQPRGAAAIMLVDRPSTRR